jgi:hypothetical protein
MAFDPRSLKILTTVNSRFASVYRHLSANGLQKHPSPMGRDDSHHIMVVAAEKDTSYAEQANYASITVLLVYRCTIQCT